MSMLKPMSHSKGFSLLELIVSILISVLLLAAINGVVNPSLEASKVTQDRNEVIQAARFAMDKMVRAVNSSQRILIPLNDKDITNYPDNIREQTVPASPPPSGSSLATAVLAITQDPSVDLNGDGVVDVDNDGDGKIDEDLPADITNDGQNGIKGIDDDGDGQVDEGFGNSDDDEVLGFANEDPIDEVDNDGDNNVDEDSSGDMNGDSAPGLAGVDDDGDGSIDEGSDNDDDEDGQNDEDWFDPVVYYMQGDALVERIPVPWDTNSSGTVTGEDYVENTILENVTRFRVERVPLGNDRSVVIDLLIEVTPPSSEMYSINTRVRVGGAL